MAAPERIMMPDLADGRPCPNPNRYLCDLGHLHASFMQAVKCHRREKERGRKRAKRGRALTNDQTSKLRNKEEKIRHVTHRRDRNEDQ